MKGVTAIATESPKQYPQISNGGRITGTRAFDSLYIELS